MAEVSQSFLLVLVDTRRQFLAIAAAPSGSEQNRRN